MAGKRLTEAEKQEVARCYRETAATATQLAQNFGVSTSTIVRFLQEGIPTVEYQALVRQKQSQSKQRRAAAPVVEAVAAPAPQPEPIAEEVNPDAELLLVEEGPPGFSMEGAADLVGDEFDDADDGDDTDEGEEDDEAADSAEFAYADADLEVLPLQDLTLPPVCYITVDKFAEIVTRPLREFQEPGRALPTDGDCPTMPLFAHHRHAKRFVQQNHRLIKVPGHLLTLTQDKLREKGIARLWFEGKVYEL